MLEVTGSGDTVLWSVAMQKLGGIWERPTTKVRASYRLRQEGFGKAERLKRVHTAHVQIMPLAQCYWWLTPVNKQKKCV